MTWGVIGGAAVSVVGGALLNRGASNAASRANNAAADAATLQAEIASDQWNRYREIYEPLERQMVSDAQNYDTPLQYAKAAGDASATVASQFGKARERLARSPGLDPSSAGYQASMVGLDLAQAANDATAQNTARQRVADTAYVRKTDALGLGKGLPANATSALNASAGNMMSLANTAQTQANNQAAAFGNVANRVFNTPTVSNWLGSVGTAMKYGTNVGSQQTNMLQEQERGL